MKDKKNLNIYQVFKITYDATYNYIRYDIYEFNNNTKYTIYTNSFANDSSLNSYAPTSVIDKAKGTLVDGVLKTTSI